MPPFIQSLLKVPLLTSQRIVLAYLVAAGADALELFLTPWLGPAAEIPDTIIDLVAMFVLSRLVGFHVGFLPTFMVEMVPGVGLFPTWLAVTVYVIGVRKSEQNFGGAPVEAPKPDDGSTKA